MRTQSLRRRSISLCGLAVLMAAASWLALSSRPTRAADEKADHPDRIFNGKDLSNWKYADGQDHKDVWKVVSEVKLDPADSAKLVGEGEGGGHDAAMFRGPIEHGVDIYSEQTFGDCEVHVEFVVPKHSNSGVYLMGQYEVQVLDSYGKDRPGAGDCGAVYSKKAPSENASKAPGEWQTFDIVFKAPRFDSSGKKTDNARFISIVHNGKKVIDNFEVDGPTGGELPGGEKAKGPLMFQGNHGIVAFRNVRVKPVAAPDEK